MLTLLDQAKIEREEGNILTANIMEIYAKSSHLLLELPFETIELDHSNMIDAGGSVKVEQFASQVSYLSMNTTYNLICQVIKKICEEDQTIDNSNKLSADVLSLNKLDQLIELTESPTHLLMNRVMKLRLQKYKYEGFDINNDISYYVDGVGKTRLCYKGLIVIEASSDSFGKPSLPFNEESVTPNSPHCTSIYCLSISEDGLIGAQTDTLQTVKIHDQLTMIDWHITVIYIENSVSKLRYIKDGPVER